MPDVSPKGTPLGPIGTKVLFENEHIRVWSIELPPNGHQPLHEHEHPYLIVPISEGRSVMKWEDGRSRDLSDVPGDIKYREASGGPHELFNLQDKKLHSVLIEIKAGGKPVCPSLSNQAWLTANTPRQQQPGRLTMRQNRLTIAALMIVMLGATTAAAQTYPSKPISIVIPLGAGGAMTASPAPSGSSFRSGSVSRS